MINEQMIYYSNLPTSVINVEIKPKSNESTHLKYRLSKTIVLFISWICSGLAYEIIGPTVTKLRIVTDTNQEQFSRALIVRSLGGMVGSFVGAIVSDKFKHRRCLLILIFLTIYGLITIIIPYSRSLTTLAINLFISDFCGGAFSTAGNPSIRDLWQDKSTGPLNFIHSGYGIGAALAPIIVHSFEGTNSSLILANSTELFDSFILTLQRPYLFTGIFTLAIAQIFLIYSLMPNPFDKLETQLCGNPRNNVKKVKHNFCPNNAFASKLWEKRIYTIRYGIKKRMFFLVILCFMGFFFVVGNERIFGTFYFSYVTEGNIKMSKYRGYLVNASYWTSYTVGRILTAFISVKISAKTLLVINMCGVLLASIILSFIGANNTVFYIFSTFFAFSQGPLFPTLLGTLNLYVPVSGLIVLIVNFGSAIGSMCCQYVTGCLIFLYGYHILPIIVTVNSVLLSIVIVLLLILTRHW